MFHAFFKLKHVICVTPAQLLLFQEYHQLQVNQQVHAQFDRFVVGVHILPFQVWVYDDPELAVAFNGKLHQQVADCVLAVQLGLVQLLLNV